MFNKEFIRNILITLTFLLSYIPLLIIMNFGCSRITVVIYMIIDISIYSWCAVHYDIFNKKE